MGKTRNWQKKKEGRERKLLKEELKKQKIAEEEEARLAEYWSIGAKDMTKINEKLEKERLKRERELEKQKIREEESLLTNKRKNNRY